MAQEQANQSSNTISYKIPVKLAIVDQPHGSNETIPFTVQPKLMVLDINGEIVEALGYGLLSNWSVTASLRNGTGDPEAKLEGNLTIPIVDGWANFTDLSISHNATNYVMDFKVSKPSSAKFNASSEVFEVKERILYFTLTTQPKNANETVPFGQQPAIEVRDAATGDIVDNTGWKGRKWLFLASITNKGANKGNLNGTTAVELVAGVATFTNLSIDYAGVDYILALEARTEPTSSYSYNIDSEAFNVTERELYLKITQQPGECNDTVICGRQPTLEVRDLYSDTLVDNIGWRQRSWFINATMVGVDNSVLNGTSQIPVPAVGRTEFQDLNFYDIAVGYQLLFTVVTKPSSSYSELSVTSDLFNVSAREFYLQIVTQPARANQSEIFGIQPVVEVRDMGTGLRTKHLKESWMVSASLKPSVLNGTLTGTSTNITVKDERAKFTNLSITFYGAGYVLQFYSNYGHQVSRNINTNINISSSFHLNTILMKIAHVLKINEENRNDIYPSRMIKHHCKA